MNKNKEKAKFATGVAAWESIMHASFWMSGSEPVVFRIKLQPDQYNPNNYSGGIAIV